MSRQNQTAYTNNSLPARQTDGGVLKPLYLQGVRIHWLKVHRDFHFKLHQHTGYELLIALRGRYQCALNGKYVELLPGRLLFVQPQDVHEDFYAKGVDFASFCFSLHDFSGALWSHGVFAAETPPRKRNILMTIDRRLSALATMTLAEAQSRRHPSLAVETMVEAFFWLLTERIPKQELSTPFSHCLGESIFRRRLYESFAHHLRKRPRMSAIAAHLGMSERTLDTQCRTVIGTSPAAAFNTYSMHEAARLIAMGVRIQEAAEQLGFTDQFYFSKVFKRHLGYPPSSSPR